MEASGYFLLWSYINHEIVYQRHFHQQLLPETGFLKSFLEYDHSFRYQALRSTFTGPVFLHGSTGALGLSPLRLSVELFTVCCYYSTPSPFLGEYLPASGAEIVIQPSVVARVGW